MKRWSLYLLMMGSGLVLAACRRSEQEANATESVTQVPTQVLKDFEMNDVQNSVKNMTLWSPEGRIYEDKQVADVDKPVVHFFKQGKLSSRLTAPSGRVHMETHDVEAWGGVTIVSADSSTLTTDRLRYEAKIAKILSDDPVRLEKPDSITDGIGLETDPGLIKVRIGHEKVHFKKGVTK